MAQLTTEQDATTRKDDQPGPGTLGAQRREQERADSTRASRPGGAAWRVVAVVVAIALAVTVGYLIGADDGDVGAVVSNAAEASTLQGEKDAIVAGAAAPDAVVEPDDTAVLQEEKEQLADAGAPGDAVTSGDDTATLQDEKEALAAEPETSVASGGDETAALRDEKAALTAPDADVDSPGDAPSDDQGEKELLLAR